MVKFSVEMYSFKIFVPSHNFMYSTILSNMCIFEIEKINYAYEIVTLCNRLE